MLLGLVWACLCAFLYKTIKCMLMLSHYSSAGFLMEQDQTDQVCEV